MTAAAPVEQISPVNVGEVIGGKYRVERVLGIGGMGVVVAAIHLQLDQRVALKFLRAEARDNDEVVERFTREARAAAKISSEHVGRVMDVGRLDSGELFMVMEYLEGRDLSNVLLVEGRLSIPRAVEYVLQACEAIAEAHVHGIVHRDLKPANLFLAKRVDGTQIIKVLDFGISKITQARAEDAAVTDPSLTNPTAVMGSPLYMSPEQMHSSVRVDARSDVWALGVILYEMVSGSTPFEAESIPLIHAAILHNAPPPLKERGVSNAPARFEAILQKCLEKDAARRYQDVGELVNALAPLSPRQGRISVEKLARLKKAVRVSDRPPGGGPVVAPDPNAPSSTITAWGEDRKRATMRRTGLLVAALLVVGGVAALVATGVLPPERRAAPVAAETASAPPAVPAPTTETTTAAADVPAPADTAEAEAALAAAKEKAGRLFKSANARFLARDYTGAATLYVQADTIYPGAKPKYKAALCFDKLQRRDDALDWYAKFLASEPEPSAFPNGEIADVKRRVEVLRKTARRPKPATTGAEPKPTETATPAATSAPTATPSATSPDPTKDFGDRE
jgi:serine/threonine-protein kinase